MAAIAMHAGSIGTTAARRPAGRSIRVGGTARRSIGAVVLAVGSLGLLVAMLPNLARVQSTDTEPLGVLAPVVVTSPSVASMDASAGSIASPAPGPHPAR